MTCFEWSLNQENESLAYCKNDVLDLMLFERECFLSIIKSEIKIIIEDC